MKFVRENEPVIDRCFRARWLARGRLPRQLKDKPKRASKLRPSTRYNKWD